MKQEKMMEQFLNNRVALVTGGTRGIGRAIAEALLDAGAVVALCGRDQAGVAQAVKEMTDRSKRKVVGTVADVSRNEDVSTLFEFVDQEAGGLDILINNAGVGVFKPVSELTVEDWRRTVETNLSGVFYCCHEALPRFKKRGGGYIVNVSSLAGKNAFAGGAAYNASKSGLNGFSEALMLDHRYDGVRVSYVMPGSVNTEFGAGASNAEWKIAPEDIAGIVLMLLQTPSRTLISRVEVRPSQPPRR